MIYAGIDAGSRAIKASGLLWLDGVLYLWVRNYKPPGSDDFTHARLAWSTDRVLAATQEKAANLGLKIALLPSWRDVDTIEDLRALIDASAADAKKPKNEQAFSTRTAGALQHLAKRLRTHT